MKNKIWFVTGASKGLGLALVKKLLSSGYRVAATSRNVKDLQNAVNAGREVFLPLAVDLINENSVENAIKETVSHFGSIDVVVNNAGYGLLGGLEELTDNEVRQQFDVNVFGAVAMMKAVLPFMLMKLNNPDLSAEVTKAVSTFLDDPKNLAIVAAPPNPVPLAMIAAGAMGAPQQLPETLGLKIIANQ